jgi:hypothetical protein
MINRNQVQWPKIPTFLTAGQKTRQKIDPRLAFCVETARGKWRTIQLERRYGMYGRYGSICRHGGLSRLRVIAR